MRRSVYVEGPLTRWPLEHFSPDEIRCKGSGLLVLDIVSGHALDALRSYLDRPLRVTSGYRSEAYNRAVGGAANSMHLRGRAFDIYAGTAREKMELISIGTLCGFRGFGWYKNFIHLDTGGRRFWFQP